MMVTTDSRRGRVALIGHYGFDPQQAGSLATLFLAAAVVASVVLSRLPAPAAAATRSALA
jgi:hypothetical protein